MNSFKTGCRLLFAAIAFSLCSCGGNKEEKKSSDTTTMSTDTTTTVTTTPVAPPVVNTTISTPQNMVVVRHKVADFAKWMTAYEGHDSARLANGLHSYVIGRGTDDSNMVLIAMKADDMAKAKAFSKMPDLKQVMQKAGVIGTPKMQFETAYFQDTVKLESPLRSMIMLTVKDKDAWQKSFDDGKQERTDNGIATRLLGYDPDDNHKIVIVTALLDSAKAHAYWKSDALKKRREAGGVTGTSERFNFTIVKRY